MTQPSKPLSLRRRRKQLGAVSTDPRTLISEDAKEAVQANLERMAKQHSSAESSTATYRLR